MGAADLSGTASTAGMHAFLFADLRGYTQFAATRGDRAAAELLDRYRSLVREQVARHAGAEVRTEGDSFYILFTSVSAAVQCALAIAAAARQASQDDPTLPLNVGIGVHFGETVDTAEGSVGSAVNLASRLASAAGPNEVLVSDVVRSLTRTSSDLRTMSAGRRRLKGFAAPVEVFRAVAESAHPPRRAVPLRLARLAAAPAALLIIVLAGGVLLLSRPGAAPGPTGSSTMTATSTRAPSRFGPGDLPAGTLIERRFVPGFQLELDAGWCGATAIPSSDSLSIFSPGNASGGLFEQLGERCAAGLKDPDAGFIDFHRVEQVYGPTGCSDGSTVALGRSWNALTDYLTNIPGTSVSNRVSTTLGGSLGSTFDLQVDDAGTCPQSGAPSDAILFFPMTVTDSSFGTNLAVRPLWWPEGQRLHVWTVDVDGELVVVIVGHDHQAVGIMGGGSRSGTPASELFVRKANRVLDSLRFLPAS